MVDLHGEGDGDGGGMLKVSDPDSSPVVVMPAVISKNAAGDVQNSEEMVVSGDLDDSALSLIRKDQILADYGDNSTMEMAGRVSNLVGFFSQNKDGQRTCSNTIMEADANLDV